MTDRARYPRSSCCVPFCRRTSTLFQGEWVCGEHWRLVDRDLKRLKTKVLRRRWREFEAAKARYDAANAACTANMPDPAHYRIEDLDRVELARRQFKGARIAWFASSDLFWGRMKRQAIERAMGISA